LHPNLAKRAFSKLEHAILVGPGFETGATERALTPRTRRQRQAPEQAQQSEGDAVALLSQNLESTEKFIAHLRRIDMDGSAPLALEALAVDIISRLNETTRDREEQVRELLKYEREFQRIAGEVGGSDALASLDALEDPRGQLADVSSSSSTSAPASSSPNESTRATRHLDPVTEEEPSFMTGKSTPIRISSPTETRTATRPT